MPSVPPRLLIAALALCSTLAAAADDTVPLTEYLQHAADAGIKIVYSSDMIPARFLVTYDPEAEVTLAKVQRAITAFGLRLVPAAADIWVVQRDPSAVTPVPAPTSLPIVERPNLEEVVVTSSRFRLLMHDATRSTLLDQHELRLRPVAGNDPLRLVSQLPGSATVGISAQPKVRGGNSDETLILFDGIRLYEPFHFSAYNNLFSGFDVRAIDSLDFYSGGYPVELGDRLSAAIVIEPIAIEENIMEAGAGLLTASWFQTHKTANDQWMFDARRSTIDLFTDLAEHDPGTPGFADLLVRYGRQTDRGDISFNLLWFGDGMDINNRSGSEYSTSRTSNLYGWTKWTAALMDTVYVDSWLSIGVIKNDRTGVMNEPKQSVGVLSDKRELMVYNLKQIWTALPGRRLHITAGWDYRYIDSSYDFHSVLTIDPAFAGLSNTGTEGVRDVLLDEIGYQGAVHASARFLAADELTVEAGIRLDIQHYEQAIHANQLSPRVNILYEPAPRTQIRIGWGEFTQAEGLEEFKVSDGLPTFQPPQKSNHTIAGIRHVFNSGLEVRLDMYHKRGLATNAYFENLTNPLSLIPELRPDRIKVSPQGFIAEGVELSSQGSIGEFDWWANYTYSSVKDRIGGVEVRRSWDQTHAVNLGVLRQVGEWDLASTVSYHDGWLTTPLRYDGTTVTALARNSMQVSNYVSLDVKASRTWTWTHNQLRLEAGVTNLLNRDNIVGFEYDLLDGALVSTSKRGLGIAPFLDAYFRF